MWGLSNVCLLLRTPRPRPGISTKILKKYPPPGRNSGTLLRLSSLLCDSRTNPQEFEMAPNVDTEYDWAKVPLYNGSDVLFPDLLA